MINGYHENSIYRGNFADEEDVYINPALLSGKFKIYGYVFCTAYLCFLLVGFYLFHSYVHFGTGQVFLLSKNDSARPFPMILIFELIPILLILFSGVTRHGFSISFFLLSVKGIISGFTLYSFAFDGEIRFTASLGVFAVYTVLYSISYIFTASGAASVSKLLYHNKKSLDTGRRSYLLKKYIFMIFPYLVLFLFTLVLDTINLGF